jgi:hypothetical protein
MDIGIGDYCFIFVATSAAVYANISEVRSPTKNLDSATGKFFGVTYVAQYCSGVVSDTRLSSSSYQFPARSDLNESDEQAVEALSHGRPVLPRVTQWKGWRRATDGVFFQSRARVSSGCSSMMRRSGKRKLPHSILGKPRDGGRSNSV